MGLQTKRAYDFLSRLKSKVSIVHFDEMKEVLEHLRSCKPAKEENEDVPVDNTKIVFEYDIPIQGKEKCDEYNKRCKEMFGKNFTPVKPTEEHIEILFEKIYEAIGKVGDAGGWYMEDGIRVKVELEYDPQDK